MAYIKYIWTNHARKALSARRIPQNFIDETLYTPERTIHTGNRSIELQKKFDDKTVTILVKKNDKSEAIIVTCWINPPYSGTKDAQRRARYLAMQKGSFLQKLWLTLLSQLGL